MLLFCKTLSRVWHTTLLAVVYTVVSIAWVEGGRVGVWASCPVQREELPRAYLHSLIHQAKNNPTYVRYSVNLLALEKQYLTDHNKVSMAHLAL